MKPECGVGVGECDGSGTRTGVGVVLGTSVTCILDAGTSVTLGSIYMLGLRTVGGGFVAVSTLGSRLACCSSDVELC